MPLKRERRPISPWVNGNQFTSIHSKELDEIVNVQLIVVDVSVVHALSSNELCFHHRSAKKQTTTEHFKKIAIPHHFCKGLATVLPMILS